MIISSRTNQFIKEVRSLKDKKVRDQLNLYLAEGVKLVREALDLNLPITRIVATESGLSKISRVIDNGILTLVTYGVFESISSESSPEGVIAIISKPLKQESKNLGSIYLDGVGDPANVGAIIRTAAASGYSTVYLEKTCADAYSPKAVRASMGGIFRVNVIIGSREELIDKIKEPIVVADMNGENAFNFEKGNYCIVIGNEANGVSEYVKKHAKYQVSIPMQNGMESLNAGVSAGILMYALKK